MVAVIDAYLIDPTEYIAAVAYSEALSWHAWKENPRNRLKYEAGKPTYEPQRTVRNLKYPDT
jgi:hypothetical protein